MGIINTSDILLPKGDLTRWSVIASDQFTAEPSYWEEAESIVGAAPSALRLMLPEAWLGTERGEGAEGRILSAMEDYLRSGVFREIEDSFFYVRRTLPDGRIRRGLLGALDLESYDFAPESEAPVRATEGTVTDRLPPRVLVRSAAALEMPHVMLLMDDPEDTVLGALEGEREELEKLYDFPLMLGGGNVAGWRVSGERAAETARALAAVESRSRNIYHGMTYAMGDGNHSLAAAKECWEALRGTLPEAERARHPARFALVEVVNLRDEAIELHPIHRVIRDTDALAFFQAAMDLSKRCTTGRSIYRVRFLRSGGIWECPLALDSMGELIGVCEELCQEQLRAHGGQLDYIHGDSEAMQLGWQEGNCAVLLPAMEKEELFSSVAASGPFPRKSFSIGRARDKRYYLECRKIK